MRKVAFLVFNILLITVGLVVALYAHATTGRYFARDVVYVAPLTGDSRLFFDPSAVELLEISFPGYTIATESRGSAVVTSSVHEASARIIYTNAAYFNMHTLHFVEGSHVATGDNFIIICKNLAWGLFGAAENITGLTAWVDDRQYIISGVVRQSRRMGYTAWLPREAAQNMSVSSLYISPITLDPLAEHTLRVMLTTYLHRNTADYAIVDINRFIESMSIRYRILLYIVWFTALIVFLRMAWKRIFQPKGRPGGKLAQKPTLPVAGIILSLYVLWGINDILLWLPNLSALDISLFTTIFTIGALPPDVYLSAGLLRLSELSRLANFAFVAGLVGYVNLLLLPTSSAASNSQYLES